MLCISTWLLLTHSWFTSPSSHRLPAVVLPGTFCAAAFLVLRRPGVNIQLDDFPRHDFRTSLFAAKDLGRNPRLQHFKLICCIPGPLVGRLRWGWPLRSCSSALSGGCSATQIAFRSALALKSMTLRISSEMMCFMGPMLGHSSLPSLHQPAAEPGHVAGSPATPNLGCFCCSAKSLLGPKIGGHPNSKWMKWPVFEGLWINLQPQVRIAHRRFRAWKDWAKHQPAPFHITGIYMYFPAL